MAKLITADTASTVQAALRSLGAGNVVGADMENLRVAVSRYVVATFGPAATKYWAQPTQAPNVHPHGQGLCAFCLEAALHCTCEHIYAGLIRLRIVTFPQCKSDSSRRASNSSTKYTKTPNPPPCRGRLIHYRQRYTHQIHALPPQTPPPKRQQLPDSTNCYSLAIQSNI